MSSEARQALPSRAAITPRQVAITVVYGTHAEQLDRTFTSFSRNRFLELHAFVLGAQLPKQQYPGIQYHLKSPDPTYSHPMRDADFRRWLFIDELEAEYALVVDGYDALCLQPLPEIPELLRGSAVAACVEHSGGRYLAGGLYTSNFLNAGVTLWHRPSSRNLRQEILARGRARFRNLVDDQLCLNEVIHSRYFDRLTILPCQYNYRAYLGRKQRGWPTVSNLDSVKIYHNTYCIEAAKRLLPNRLQAELSPLKPDPKLLGPWAQRWRRLQSRLLRLGSDH